MKEKSQIESNHLQALLNNDRAGIKRIYREMYPGIEAWVRHNNGNAQDAGDVLQDAIIVVFEKASRPEFQLTGSFKNYLTSICRFVWLRKLKKNKRTSFSLPEEKDLAEDPIIESVLHEEEREALFQKYFRDLNQICRTVLTLFFEGEKMSQIAEQLGYTEKFARVKKHLCQKKLIEKIQLDGRYRELALG